MKSMENETKKKETLDKLLQQLAEEQRRLHPEIYDEKKKGEQ